MFILKTNECKRQRKTTSDILHELGLPRSAGSCGCGWWGNDWWVCRHGPSAEAARNRAAVQLQHTHTNKEQQVCNCKLAVLCENSQTFQNYCSGQKKINLIFFLPYRARGTQQQAVNTTLDILSPCKIYMANVLANHCLFTHPADTEQHQQSCLCPSGWLQSPIFALLLALIR